MAVDEKIRILNLKFMPKKKHVQQKGNIFESLVQHFNLKKVGILIITMIGHLG